MTAALSIPAVTALELRRAGVEFRRDPKQGNHIVALKGPKSLCAAASEEIARRASMYERMIPTAEAIIPLLVIAARAPDARVGQCSSCGDQMESHVGGTCSLCDIALRKALQATGRLPK